MFASLAPTAQREFHKPCNWITQAHSPSHQHIPTGSQPRVYDCRKQVESHEWKSKLEIHSRLPFRVHCPWQWVTSRPYRSGKQPTKQRSAWLSVSFNDCSYQMTWQTLNIALQQRQIKAFVQQRRGRKRWYYVTLCCQSCKAILKTWCFLSCYPFFGFTNGSTSV